MDIVAIEFDRTRFDNPIVCEKWMRESGSTDLLALLDRKTFKLKSGPSIFLSDEKRKVWSWYGNVWREKGFRSERLDTHVVAIRGLPTMGYWDTSDVPTPLIATQEKRRKLDLLREKREFKRREATERLKEKRKKDGKLKKDDPSSKGARPPRKPKVSKAKLTEKAKTARPHSPIFGPNDVLADALPPSIIEAAREVAAEETATNLLLDEDLP